MNLKEIQSITTEDGKSLKFSEDPYLQGFVNYGMAQVDFVTQKGYRQIGTTVRDFSLGSRTVTLSIGTKSEIKREDYWSIRQDLLNIFRPNRGLNRLNELTLAIRFDDGTKRVINGFYQSGLEYQDVDTQENAFRIQAQIAIFCPNPIWYDNTIISKSPAASSASELVFPITFPITFETSGTVYNTGELNYAGNWRAYPTITIDGPYETATVTHQPSGTEIILNNSIGAGEQRIITLSETGFTLVNENGEDKFSDILTANFVDFYIRSLDQYDSDNEEQSINVNLLNGSAGTSGATIEYQEAYIGI